MNEKIAVSFRLRPSDLAVIDGGTGQNRTEKLEFILRRYVAYLEVMSPCIPL